MSGVCQNGLLLGHSALQTLMTGHVQLDYMDRVIQALQEVRLLLPIRGLPLTGQFAT